MKKVYKSPRIIVLELSTECHLLESSYTEIGGTTDKFGAKRNRFADEDYDDFETGDDF